MKTLIASMIALVTCSHAQAASGIELCQRLVIQRTTQGKPQAAPLSELKRFFSANGGATAVFEVDLKGLRPSLDSLYELTQPGDEWDVPVRFLNESSLLFIAQGSSAGFAKMEKRIRGSDFAGRTTFHILSAKALNPVTAPRAILQTDEEIQDARKGKDPFAVFTADQIVFMIPHGVIDQFDSGEMKRKKIAFGRVFRPPNSWTDWLQKRADDFKDKIIISTGDWAAVSKSAFVSLQEISGAEGYETPPEMRALNRRILDLLELPPDAEKSARAEPNENATKLPKNARKILMAYLSAHRARTKLNEPDGLERAFLALAKLAPTDPAAEKYRKAIRKIGFTRWEYSSFAHEQPSSTERVTAAWLVFLKTMKSTYADKPVNARNLQLAVKQLPE